MDSEKRNEPLEILAIVIIGIALRLIAGRNTLIQGGILFDGYDEYYHMRRILFTISHFPNTLWFDSYLNYPEGMNLTWPPLYDQLTAAIALITFSRTQGAAERIGAIVPVIIGAVAIAVVYFMVREAFGRNIALLSAFMASIAPYYLQKTMLGAADHHSLEVLLLTASVMFLVFALTWKDKNYTFAAAAGVAMTALAYTWLGAAVYILLIFVYAAIQITLDLKNGQPSRNTVTILLIALGVSLALMLPFWNNPWLSPTFIGVLGIATVTAFLYILSQAMIKAKAPWGAFPVAFVALIYIFIMIAQTFSNLWFFSKINDLVISGGDFLFSGNMNGKIAEAQPLLSAQGAIFSGMIPSTLGWTIICSLAGFAAAVLYMRRSNPSKKRAQVLVTVFAALALFISFGQMRFLYLSSVTMGIMISILFFEGLDMVREKAMEIGKTVPVYMAAALLIILILPTALEASPIFESVPPIAGDWLESLNWLKANTNQTSFYNSPDKCPEYSIMSWWDYGNWILYQAQRPVVANNFQAGVQDSAKFYLSQNENEATTIMGAHHSKYVITDYEMIYGKLQAITIWAGKDISDYQIYQDYGTYVAAVPLQKLMGTTLARLHLFDGTGMGHFRLIYESSSVIGANPPTSRIKIFQHVPGALIRVHTQTDMNVGALLNMTSNQGRQFQYVNQAAYKNGTVEIRVPYSTEPKYGTRAVNPYLVFAGNNARNIRTKELEISEADVLEGKTLEVTP